METIVENKKIEINKDNPKILVAVYGSLRLGRSNYTGLGLGLDHRSKYLGTYKTEPKFTMYGKNKAFPVVSPVGNTKIEYDLLEITSQIVLQNIHDLEGFTGYQGDERNWYDCVELQNEEYRKIYMYVQYDVDRDDIIESGNWNNRI